MDKTRESHHSDAGLRELDHYEKRLPQWRYRLRQRMLPCIRYETPYLAWLQAKTRSPLLDSYFAISANLGTHTFFMIILPILFWCGYTGLGRAMVHVLASGVFFSGFIKDLLCLPRPLSPPLTRITMSGSAALEYGFPSTHSTNAISVALYSLFILDRDSLNISRAATIFLQGLAFCYATSLVLGRIYCGMHGFLDVITGSSVGAIVSIVQYTYGGFLDTHIYTGSIREVTLFDLIIIVLVRVHPEPADDCPCFDDTVAFAGVMIGVEYGNWHFAQTEYAWSTPVFATVPFNLQIIGWPRTILRIMLGVLTIFTWKEVMKPLLLRNLPPVFRVVEELGLTLPRKFFVRASQYTKIPKHHKDDNVIPSVSEIPDLLRSLGRRRAVSIGPQSEADAYETIAYQEKRRRDSASHETAALLTGSINRKRPYLDLTASGESSSSVSGRSKSTLDRYESMMGTGFAKPKTGSSQAVSNDQPGTMWDSKDEKAMFGRLQRPRVRYDVEVVTKLIVYSGIGWLAVEGDPILFHMIGLGI